MEITICPKCQKPIEASDYSNRLVWGGLIPKIKCKNCKYSGLPIVLSEK